MVSTMMETDDGSCISQDQVVKNHRDEKRSEREYICVCVESSANRLICVRTSDPTLTEYDRGDIG
jgi:hypothetical protein